MIYNTPTMSLTEQLYQIETLEAAWRKVRANKGGPGSGIEFLGHIFDKDGCYQPLPNSQTKNLQKQVKHVLRQGTSHVKRSGRQVTQRGKNIATQLGKRLKKQDIQSPDPINAMLSLGYTLLHNHVYAFINVVGFDPYCGYYHQPKHGHAALASDLMEEFRQIIVDGYVLSLVNNKRVRPEDFEQTDKGSRFTKQALDKFLAGFYGRMQQTFQHPTLHEKTNYLRSIELQVRHFARVIIGKDATYKPFLIRV